MIGAAREKMSDGDKNHCAESGSGEGIEKAAIARANAELAKDPAAQDRADETENDVRDAPETPPPRDLSGKPSGDKADEDPAEKAPAN